MPGNVARLLDEEHQGTLDVLARVERVLGRRATDRPVDAELASVVGKLREHLIGHVPRHFEFEEEELFPRLTAAGEGDLCELLTEEHVAVRAVISEILPHASRVDELAAGDVQVLERAIRELIERLRSHIEKETVALVPACVDGIDDTTDQELALQYAGA